MQLLTDELRTQLPALHAQQGKRDPTVYARFFMPDGGWSWYVTEGSFVGDYFQFFGYVIGLAEEWNYFLLSDLTKSRGPRGAQVARDLRFKPAPFSEVIESHRLRHSRRLSKGGR